MSGIEVVALVAGIVSAFGGAAELYKTWRDRRKERRENKENTQLHQLVQSSSLQIRQEYDNDFRRLGKVFARGDGLFPHFNILSHELI